ncbi:MAG: TonB family protein [Planctomycetia bacterium]|nr:TonB family protein [Planctomycetia bacterium]
MRRFLLDYAVFVLLLGGSVAGHYWFVFHYHPGSTVIRIALEPEAGRTSVAITLIAAKPKVELPDLVKPTKLKELPKPLELLIAKVELPPEAVITAELPRPQAVAVPIAPPPMEKIEEEEKPPEEQPLTPPKRKQPLAKPPETETIESDSTVTIVTQEMRGIVTAPTILSRRLPIYPPYAYAQKLDGSADLAVHVSTEGKVLSVSVFKSSGYSDMDQAWIEAVRDWTFTPALRDGKPVDQHVHVPVTFRIRKTP